MTTKKKESKLNKWIKKQSFFSVCSYLFGLCGFIIMIDGLFVIPIEITRYGLSNIGIDTALILIIGSMVFNNTHMIQNKGRDKNE